MRTVIGVALTCCCVILTLNVRLASAEDMLSPHDRYLITSQAFDDFVRSLLPTEQHRYLLRPRFQTVRHLLALSSTRRPQSLAPRDASTKLQNEAQPSINAIAAIRQRLHRAMHGSNQWRFVENLGALLYIVQTHYANGGAELASSEEVNSFLLGNYKDRVAGISDLKERAYNVTHEMLARLLAPFVYKSSKKARPFVKPFDLLGLCQNSLTAAYLIRSNSVINAAAKAFLQGYLLQQASDEQMQFCDTAHLHVMDGSSWLSKNLAHERNATLSQNLPLPKSHRVTLDAQLSSLTTFLQWKADIASNLYIFSDDLTNWPPKTEQNALWVLLNHIAKERGVRVNAVVFPSVASNNKLPLMMGLANKELFNPDRLEYPELLPVRNLIGLAQASGGFYFTFSDSDNAANAGQLAVAAPLLYSSRDRLVFQALMDHANDGSSKTVDFNQIDGEQIFVVATCFSSLKYADSKVGLKLTSDTRQQNESPVDVEIEFLSSTDSSAFHLLESRKENFRQWSLGFATDRTYIPAVCHVRGYARQRAESTRRLPVKHFFHDKSNVQFSVTVPERKQNDYSALTTVLIVTQNDQLLPDSITVRPLQRSNSEEPSVGTRTTSFRSFRLTSFEAKLPQTERFYLLISSKHHDGFKIDSGSALEVPSLVGGELKIEFNRHEQEGAMVKLDGSDFLKQSNLALSQLFSCSSQLPVQATFDSSLLIRETSLNIHNPSLRFADPCQRQHSFWCFAVYKTTRATITKPAPALRVVAEAAHVLCVHNYVTMPFDGEVPKINAASMEQSCAANANADDCDKREWIAKIEYSPESAMINVTSGNRVKFTEREKITEIENHSGFARFKGDCCTQNVHSFALNKEWGLFDHAELFTQPTIVKAQSTIWIILGILGGLLLLLLIAFLVIFIQRKKTRTAEYSTVSKSAKDADNRAAAERQKSASLKSAKSPANV